MREISLEIINSKVQRCVVCDTNLMGSIWRGITIALVSQRFGNRGRHNTVKRYCVHCMTKKGDRYPRKYSRNDEQLDNFVDDFMSKNFRN